MEIIKRHKTDNYSTIDNLIFRRADISIKAKGLYSMVMSLPATWDFSIEGFVKIAKEGKTAIYSAIKELIEYGYCSKHQIREGGQFKGVEYSFYERPEYNPNYSPYSENPHTDNPHTEKPYLENQPQLKHVFNKNMYSSKTCTNKDFGYESNFNKNTSSFKEEETTITTSPLKEEISTTCNSIELRDFEKESNKQDFEWRANPDELEKIITSHFKPFSLRDKGIKAESTRKHISYALRGSEIETDYPLMLYYYTKCIDENLLGYRYSLEKWFSEGWNACDWQKKYIDLSSKKILSQKVQRKEQDFFIPNQPKDHSIPQEQAPKPKQVIPNNLQQTDLQKNNIPAFDNLEDQIQYYKRLRHQQNG